LTMAAVLESPAMIGMACGSCGADAWSPDLTDLTDYLTHETFQIHRCNTCGLLMTQPLPMGQAIGRYYPERYRGNRHGFTSSLRCNLRRRMIESQFPAGFRGRILDIGCGDGSFALHMQARGWNVAATEIDPTTIDRLSKAGIDAKLSSSAAAEGFDKPFDAITCWHVLEHMENPREVAEWVRTQLARGGLFQVTVPNVSSLQARVFGRSWIHLDVPRHRQHFTPETLKTLLGSTGLTIQRRSNFALEYDWFGVIQSVLNVFCTKPNVLFERLIHSPKDDIRRSSLADKFLTVLLTPPIAVLSLPMILTSAAAGDGATLTLTCKARD
jgi:2-polyprenyl-3-methyl-5-hydroxy-6-metoxy-1,4-benzoquinol methylase